MGKFSTEYQHTKPTWYYNNANADADANTLKGLPCRANISDIRICLYVSTLFWNVQLPYSDWLLYTEE